MLSRSTIRFAVKALVSLGAAAYIFYTFQVRNLLHLIAELNPALVFVAASLSFLHLFILAWRWKTLYTGLFGISVPLAMFILALSRSLVFGFVLPTTVGMDVVRSAIISRKAPAGLAVRSVVMDRIFGLTGLIILAAAALPFLPSLNTYELAWTAAVLLTAGLALVFALLVSSKLARRKLPKLAYFVASFLNDLRLILSSHSARTAALLALVGHALNAVTFAFLVESVDPHAPILTCAIIFLPSALISSLPISLSGWGLREATIASAFAIAGVDATTGLTSSVLFGALSPVTGLFGEILVSVINQHAAPLTRPKPDRLSAD